MALPALLAAGVIGFVLGVIGSDQYEKDCAERKKDAETSRPAERRKAAEDSHLTDEADKDDGSVDFYSDEDEDMAEYEYEDDDEDMDESYDEEDEDGRRCEYVSEDGIQCRNRARPGSRFCGVHDTDAFDDAEDLI